MAVDLYCVQHARDEQLVRAAAIARGRSACVDHAGGAAGATALPAGENAPRCSWCDPAVHRAYFVVDERPGCVRHAADATFGDDDMGAHDMAHAAYLALRAAGVTDAY